MIKFAPSSSGRQKSYNIFGLGGERGDYFLKIVDSISTKLGHSISFYIMPLTFEGTKRMEMAKYQLETIRGFLDIP